MDLSIIIVNYNVKYFLEQCLCSVQAACKNIDAEIFVVDNRSTDGSREWLAPKFPEVNFKWQPANTGFARANNSVLPEVKGNHILFLNPDTIVPEDCFEKCLAFFSANENCGALGVKMIDGTGNFLKESKRSFPSPSASFFKMTGLTKLFPASKSFSKYYAGHLSQNVTNDVEVLAGAFLMIHKKTLHAVKGFDEDFFMYAEDIDLSYRILKAGFKNYYFPQTMILHFKGESTRKKSLAHVEQFYGAMNLFVRKHFQEKKATRLFMLAAIGGSKMLSQLKLYITNAVNNLVNAGSEKAASRETLIIADQAYFDEMIQLVKYARPPLTIQGRVSVIEKEMHPSLGTLNDTEQIIKKNKTKNIIFCQESLSFQRIIALSQQLKNTGIFFLFHAAKTESIVGSNNKNSNGIFIAKPLPRRSE